MKKQADASRGINDTIHLAADAGVALFERLLLLLLLLLGCRPARAAPRRARPPLERIIFDVATLKDK